MSASEALLAASAAELAALYRAGRTSPVEVAEAVLGRIGTLDGELGAFCLVDDERALEPARESERRWRAGEPIGALDGIPVAVKDVFLTRGWPTLRGSWLIDEAGPWDTDAPAVAALRRHGAVLPGKTTTPELGWKGVTDSPRFGVTRNPWDRTRTSGGSSGGSAAALASGMARSGFPAASAGSRASSRPSDACRRGRRARSARSPTRVRWRGRSPTSRCCSTCWPSPIRGTGRRSPRPPEASPTASTTGSPACAWPSARISATHVWTQRWPTRSRARRARSRPSARTSSPSTPASAIRAKPSRSSGRRAPPAPSPISAPRRPSAWTRGSPRPPSAGAGSRCSITSRTSSVATRSVTGRAASMPSGTCCSPRPSRSPRSPRGRDVPEESGLDGWPAWTPFTYPFNLTQQPAATVPCGFTRSGLPIGLQIVGGRYADALILRVARAYEAAHPQPTLTTPETSG